jgi:protein-disulfide isomerase
MKIKVRRDNVSDSIQYLVVGSEDANVEIESFINVGCPFCANYLHAVNDLFEQYLKDGQIKHVIKHVDRTKSSLLKGSVANTYLDISKPEEAYNLIKTLAETRSEWSNSFPETLNKVEGELHLSEQSDAGERSVAILNEAAERGVKVVPTVFINGEKFNFSVKGEAEEIRKEFQGKLESL